MKECQITTLFAFAAFFIDNGLAVCTVTPCQGNATTLQGDQIVCGSDFVISNSDVQCTDCKGATIQDCDLVDCQDQYQACRGATITNSGEILCGPGSANCGLTTVTGCNSIACNGDIDCQDSLITDCNTVLCGSWGSCLRSTIRSCGHVMCAGPAACAPALIEGCGRVECIQNQACTSSQLGVPGATNDLVVCGTSAVSCVDAAIYSECLVCENGSCDYCEQWNGLECPSQDGEHCEEPGPNPNPNPWCFSDRTEVQVQHKGIVRLGALKIGDAVLAGDGSYSTVYGFGHYSAGSFVEFLQLFADNMDTPLEITADHMLLVYSDKTTSLLPAGFLKVGDTLVSDQGSPATIESVRTVVRRGLYAPLTITGDIVVNGVIASNYVELSPAASDLLSFEMQHWIHHAAYVPYRLYCRAFGCENETYDNATGLSKGIAIWFPLLRWMEAHPIAALPTFLYVVAVPGHWILLLLEKLVQLSVSHLVAVALALLVWKQTQIATRKVWK